MAKNDTQEVEHLLPNQPKAQRGTKESQTANDIGCVRTTITRRLFLPSLTLNVILLGLNLVQIFVLPSKEVTKYRVSISQWRPRSGSSSSLTIPVSNFTSYTPYEKIFGHIHIAKTAGTEINGELAAHYERICGHKG